MTYELVFEHEPPIKGRRVCLANIGGVKSPEEAEAAARERWPGIVRFKRIVLQVKPPRIQRKGQRDIRLHGMTTAARPVVLPSDLTSRILSRSRGGGGGG